MKKLLLLAFGVASLLSSCTQSELLNNETTKDSPMTFQAVVGKNSVTRDYPTSPSAYPTTSSFGTTAFFVQEGRWSDKKDETTTTTYIDNQKVEYYTNAQSPYDANSWHIGYAAYWPKQGSLTFFSYSPYSLHESVTIDKTDGVKIENFDLSVHNNVDLMVADIKADQKADNTSNTYGFNGVPTLFRHKLTQIGFNVKLAADYSNKTNNVNNAGHKVITLTGIKIKNIYNKGTYKQGVDADDCTGSWTSDENLSDKEFAFFTGTQVLSTTDFAVPTENAEEDTEDSESENTENAESNAPQIYFLPQTFTDQSTAVIEVTYTIDTYTSANDKSTETVTYTKDLKDIKDNSGDSETICSWGINKKITYNLTIGLELIYFDPAVQDWDEDSHGIEL